MTIRATTAKVIDSMQELERLLSAWERIELLDVDGSLWAIFYRHYVSGIDLVCRHKVKRSVYLEAIRRFRPGRAHSTSSPAGPRGRT